ncbi:MULTISPECIES: hypothetical protein [unclassified Nocardiopsis]|uniref:hypothetical protein n=1 Tax=Nocardiopsis TaxID=2013 RepID=UPI00387B6BD1
MNVHKLPPPTIVAEAWAGIDTSIDDEHPQVLSPEQFERYCSTMRNLLRASDLDVEDFDNSPASFLVVTDDDFRMEIKLDPERVASVELVLVDDLLDQPTTVELTEALIALLHRARNFHRE